MRAQAEIISTVIIVSVALVIAFGLIYYLNPYVVRSQSQFKLYSTLSSYASSLSIVPVSTINSTNITAVFILENTGSVTPRLYLAIVPFYGQVPVATTVLAQVYNMTGNYSVIDASDVTGWTILNATNISAFHIHLYVSSSYYRLSDLAGSFNVSIYDLGIIGPREVRVIKAILSNPEPIYNYAAIILARVNNEYYEIGRYILYSGS